MRSLFAEPLKHAHLSDSFLFRGIPHTARVQQDHIGLRFVQYHAIAAHDERSRDLLGIALVHLAAVGLDVNAGHGSGTQT